MARTVSSAKTRIGPGTVPGGGPEAPQFVANVGGETALTVVSEALLIEECRAGRPGAILELFRMHWEPTLAYAKRFSSSLPDAEDIAATAFLKSLSAMRRGNGPDEAMLPYLYRAVRTTAADHHGAAEVPLEGIVDAADRKNLDSFHEGTEAHDFVADAFAVLPLRWQRVLWYVEIEGLKPREVAPLLGISPNSTSALLRRARKGLRESFLLMHARNGENACESMIGALARVVGGNNSPREQAVVDLHVRTCRECGHTLRGLRAVGSRMKALINPWMFTVLLSPVTAVRILKLSSPVNPLACMVETMNDPDRMLRLVFHSVRSLCAAAAAFGIMVLPVSSDVPAQSPQGTHGECGPYGTAIGCHHQGNTDTPCSPPEGRSPSSAASVPRYTATLGLIRNPR